MYRFLATGTIEEKVYQRQLSKEGLQQVSACSMAGLRCKFGINASACNAAAQPLA